MAKQFDFRRYQELIKLDEMKKGGLDFWSKDFRELLQFQGSIQSQISYNRKDQYFSLVQKYLNGMLTVYEFQSNFLELEEEDRKTSDTIEQNSGELEVFMLADELEEFSNWQNRISILIIEYDKYEERMSDDEFYSIIKDSYLQLQKALPILFNNSLIYENLVSRSFKILAGIIGLGITFIFLNISNPNLIIV